MQHSAIVDPVIRELYARFFDGEPVSCESIETGVGDDDYRKTVIVTATDGEKVVLKIVSNDFTFPDKIRMWQRTVEEYRDLGYYCPQIIGDRNGEFPMIDYRGRRCVVYAEEFSRYRTLEDRMAENAQSISARAYAKDIWRMTAMIAAKQLDYTAYPSAYCLFERFCPSDETDEVLYNALEWKKLADALPGSFSGQVQRIWTRWNENRDALRPLYKKLPTSVFQADLNATNLLVDENGAFKGVMDFNLCGKEVFLNYLMRENYDDFEEELDLIREALRISSAYYAFSEDEKQAVLPLYRCLKPLWYTRVEDLEEAGDDEAKIREILNRIEQFQTAEIDFTSCMG
ncbi:MAG: phosphotransferase [Clostridia bacterium]|nr:phosphotransferase [Clostridia bacterium]